MHRIRRGVAVASGTLALIAAIAGCAGAGTSTEDVTLTYGMWDKEQQPAMQQIIDQFEKENPHIKVRLAVTPWDSYWTKLKTAATAGSAPDVFWMMNDQLKLYASGGALLNLDDEVEKDGFNMSDFVPSSAESVRWDGHTWGLPKDTNSFGVFYNKDLFTAAGVPFPDDDWTWDDVAAAAEQLTDPAAGIYGVAAPAADVLGYYLTIPQAGGHVISADGTTSGYDDPKTIEGLEFWTQLIEDGVSPTEQQMTDTDPLTMFTSGKIAMYYGGSWDPIAITQVPAAAEFTGVAALPKKLDNSFYSNGIANVISGKTSHPAEAWQFLKFLGGPAAAEIQAETGTVIPALQGHNDQYAKAFPGLDLQVLIDQLPNAKPIPSSLNTQVWSDAAIQEFTRAWDGTQTVPEAAAKVAAFMNDALAKESAQ